MSPRNASQRFVVASTDADWFRFLRSRPEIADINFWRPTAVATKEVPGTLWFFRIRGGKEIAGYAIFAAYSVMPLQMAWETFGIANGVSTYSEFLNKLARIRGKPTNGITEIGCAALVQPTYFRTPVEYRRMYGPVASGSTEDAQGAALWDQLRFAIADSQLQSRASPLVLPGGFGAPTLVAPRLGQPAFRTAILSAYERRCTVTGERTLPVLEAAHIRPFAENASHEVTNGLLLRSDLHTLFDAGLVTIDADFRFRVSSQIRERYENGREYYALDSRLVRLPERTELRPARDALSWHSEVVFQP